MIECARGFITVKRETDDGDRAVQVFRRKVGSLGHTVVRIISVKKIGEMVYAIVANVSTGDD